MATTLSEIFRDQPAHLHLVLPLDFESVTNVPDSHRWPTYCNVHGQDLSLVPVIDLEATGASLRIGAECEALGIFQVINHGIPLDVMDTVESEAKKLFALPAIQKLKTLRSPNGAAGYGVARIAPFFDKYMWHEGFTMIGSPIDHAKLLWPHDYHRFCEVMLDYEERMKDLVSALLRAVLQYLRMSDEDEEEGEEWLCAAQRASPALQLNSYPPCPEPSGAMGLAPHTDTSLLTVLHQNGVAGLEIFHDTVGWVPVKPRRGALVVNVGDLLHILSNGRLPSVVHRVVMEEARGEQRLSVAYFSGLPMGLNLYPLGLGPGKVPKYRNLSLAEYAGIKATTPDKALSFISMYADR